MLILNGKESIFVDYELTALQREPSIKVQWIVKFWGKFSEAGKGYLLKIKNPKTIAQKHMEILGREQLTL